MRSRSKPRLAAIPEEVGALLEILKRRPASLDELGQVSGIGQAKLVRYGNVFLRVVKEVPDEAGS